MLLSATGDLAALETYWDKKNFISKKKMTLKIIGTYFANRDDGIKSKSNM